MGVAAGVLRLARLVGFGRATTEGSWSDLGWVGGVGSGSDSLSRRVPSRVNSPISDMDSWPDGGDWLDARFVSLGVGSGYRSGVHFGRELSGSKSAEMEGRAA